MEEQSLNTALKLENEGNIFKVVDASLFPFSFERSRGLRQGSLDLHDCIERCTKGEVLGSPQNRDPEGPSNGALVGRGIYTNDKAWSLRYQWLPFEVSIGNEESSTRYNSFQSANHRVRRRLNIYVVESQATSTTCIQTQIDRSTASWKV